jgi:hypothetical protein
MLETIDMIADRMASSQNNESGIVSSTTDSELTFASFENSKHYSKSKGKSSSKDQSKNPSPKHTVNSSIHKRSEDSVHELRLLRKMNSMAKATNIDFEMSLMVREMATQRIVEDRIVEWKASARPGTPACFYEKYFVLSDSNQIEKHREESASVPSCEFDHHSFNIS